MRKMENKQQDGRFIIISITTLKVNQLKYSNKKIRLSEWKKKKHNPLAKVTMKNERRLKLPKSKN